VLKSDFQIDIPEQLIAQFPSSDRTASRLMVLDGGSGELTHGKFADLPQFLRRGDRLVFNNTKVIPARLFGQKESGGKIEVFLERITTADSALVKLRASKSPQAGQKLLIADRGGQADVCALVVEGRDNDLYRVRTENGQAVDAVFHDFGHIPLPPYIERDADATDEESYQTVYAEHQGAVAAPTAGLHFDHPMLARLASQGIDSSFVTLHVGAGTFQPVREDDVSDHVMHSERYDLSTETVAEIESTRSAGGRIIAVGTTSARTLEAAAGVAAKAATKTAGKKADSGTAPVLAATDGLAETDLFIKPGDHFRVVDAMITNFHLSESTLLMLICAFAGTRHTLAAYRSAIEERYRFFSYGDAMLVWPQKS